MFKQFVSVIIIGFVVNLALAPSALASDKLSKEAKLAAKVKAGIAKLGTGKDARIKVKLKDGMKLKGYVSEISEDGFTITDPGTGIHTKVPYPNAKQIRGNNLATNVKVAIGLGILLAVILIIYAAGPDD